MSRKRKIDTNEIPDFYTTCTFIERQIQKLCTSSLRYEATLAKVSLYYYGYEGFSLNTYLNCEGANNFVKNALQKIGIEVTNGSLLVRKEAIVQFAKSHKTEIWEEVQQRRNRVLQQQKSLPLKQKPQEDNRDHLIFTIISRFFRCLSFKRKPVSKKTKGGAA
jgi:hypothetical protein